MTVRLRMAMLALPRGRYVLVIWDDTRKRILSRVEGKL